jgi:hypothetical protein
VRPSERGVPGANTGATLAAKTIDVQGNRSWRSLASGARFTLRDAPLRATLTRRATLNNAVSERCRRSPSTRALYFTGTGAILLSYSAFSPVTRDIVVLLSCHAQIATFRRRHALWGIGIVCLGQVLIFRALANAETGIVARNEGRGDG